MMWYITCSCHIACIATCSSTDGRKDDCGWHQWHKTTALVGRIIITLWEQGWKKALRMYLWRNLHVPSVYSHARWVTAGDPGLCCCVHVTFFFSTNLLPITIQEMLQRKASLMMQRKHHWWCKEKHVIIFIAFKHCFSLSDQIQYILVVLTKNVYQSYVIFIGILYCVGWEPSKLESYMTQLLHDTTGHSLVMSQSLESYMTQQDTILTVDVTVCLFP